MIIIIIIIIIMIITVIIQLLVLNVNYLSSFFFSIRVFSTDTDDSQDSRGRERTIFYSTLPLPPAHEHSDIYLQLCMWDDYHVFLIATPVFTRLMMQYSFIYLMNWYKIFVTASWHWKQVDLNWHRLSPLYYKRTD